MSSKTRTWPSTKNCSSQTEQLAELIRNADAVLIGAGSGLSSAAGFEYSGKRFTDHFRDFQEKYGISDMYSGGFYPFETLEEYWAWWSRHIWINRYENPPRNTYELLLQLVRDKDYFVLTTNVDHLFQKNGFAKERLFYTQGDYGLLQCVRGCHPEVCDNEELIRTMVHEQKAMKVPSSLIPRCPVCGSPMVPSLRTDDHFVEDKGWHQAQKRYQDFLQHHRNSRIVYLELGVGQNTPGIIKYPFWNLTMADQNAFYVCINSAPAYIPREIQNQSLMMTGDIHMLLQEVVDGLDHNAG